MSAAHTWLQHGRKEKKRFQKEGKAHPPNASSGGASSYAASASSYGAPPLPAPISLPCGKAGSCGEGVRRPVGVDPYAVVYPASSSTSSSSSSASSTSSSPSSSSGSSLREGLIAATIRIADEASPWSNLPTVTTHLVELRKREVKLLRDSTLQEDALLTKVREEIRDAEDSLLRTYRDEGVLPDESPRRRPKRDGSALGRRRANRPFLEINEFKAPLLLI